MNIFTSFGPRGRGARAPADAGYDDFDDTSDNAPDPQPRDVKRIALVVGLGILSWVATYVGMLELIEANMGDLPFIHKIIVGFSVAMLMTMIVWLLDRIFAPIDLFTKACYVAGYIFLSVISVGFGFGFYWKVLESRGEASRSAESAITQVQTSLFGAATRLEQLQSTLDQLTNISSEKSELERTTGRSCPNSGPGDGPRRKMREEDAGRFKFASDFVKGRVGTVKSDMAGLDADLQKIVKDDRSVIDAKTGTRNDFLRGVGRKLDLTVTGFNAFRTDPQLKQIRQDLADRAEKTTISGNNGSTIACPDAQLQMALRGVVRAIDQLPELEKPKIAAVEGSEATIEAFRRLTATFFGLMTFKLPPSADELRELQKKAVQSMEMQGGGTTPARAAAVEQTAGLAKRDYVPLSVAIFVDLCLLLVSIGRPMNRFVGMQAAIREAERGPVYPILSRFHAIHADDERVKIFEVFREVIFDLNGHYHVAVPLNVPRHAPDRAELKREAQHLANVCYALEGKDILVRPWGFLPGLLAHRELRRRGSKFVEAFGDRRTSRLRRGFDGVRSVWADTAVVERPAFKVYRFRPGAWQEMILGAVMGAAHHAERDRRRNRAFDEAVDMTWPTGRHDPRPPSTTGRDREPQRDWHPEAPQSSAAYGTYARYMTPRHDESPLRSSVLDELRPGSRVESAFAPPPARGTNGAAHAAPFDGHAADVVDVVAPPARAHHAPPAPAPLADAVEPANNNTEPGRRLSERLSDATPAADDASEERYLDADAVAAVVDAIRAEAGAEHAQPAPATPAQNVAEILMPEPILPEPVAHEPIAVDEISDWFGRQRRKA